MFSFMLLFTLKCKLFYLLHDTSALGSCYVNVWKTGLCVGKVEHVD